MEKLIFKAKDRNDERQHRQYNPVFLDYKSHQKVKSLSEATGISMRDIVRTFIDFGIENMAVEESEDGSKPE
ncbi:hypothetical protein ACJQWY_01195 [Weissella kandleri]|uniref:hypothetical protein n=1 Tax=Weissella kandleri TaxID=1616 RepID=UPI00387E65EF